MAKTLVTAGTITSSAEESSSDSNSSGESSSDDDDVSTEQHQQNRGKQFRGKQFFCHHGKNFAEDNAEEDEDNLEEEEEDSEDTGHPTSHSHDGGDAVNEISFHRYEMLAHLLPLLLLHEKSQTNTQNMPETLALGVNLRPLSGTRFNCLKLEDNMLYKMRNETEKTVSSVTDGGLHIVMTSYQQSQDELPETTNKMKSVLFPLESNNDSVFVAVSVTMKIIANAIAWLRGKDWRKQQMSEDDITSTVIDEINKKSSDDPTLDTAMSIFFQELEKVMPTTMDPEDLLAFINNHEWGEKSTDCFENHDGYKLRRFIHENLANQTMVVAHIVDGIHRVTAIDCAYTGYSYISTTEDKALIKEYSTKLPHKKTMMSIHVHIPTDVNDKFVKQMNIFSKDIQCYGDKNMPHSIRNFLANEIQTLHSLCIERKVPYLQYCVNEVYKVIEGQTIGDDKWQVIKDGIPVKGEIILGRLESLRTTTNRADSNMHLVEDYISLWVENLANLIIGMKCDDSKLVPTMWKGKFLSNEQKQEETKLSCFKKVNQGKMTETNSCNINPFNSKTRQTTSFLNNKSFSSSPEDTLMKAATDIDNWNSTFTDNRFFSQKKGAYYPAQGVIIYQILLWSYLCKETHDLLSNHFSHSQPNRLQYTVGDVNDAFQQTTNIFQNVIDSVAASYTILKSYFFIKDKKKANHIRNNPEQAIHLCLLISAIKECIPYFDDLGLKPVPPDKIKAIIQVDCFDYITLLVGSHAICMSDGVSDLLQKGKQSLNLRHDGDVINPDKVISSKINIPHVLTTSIKDHESLEFEQNLDSKFLRIMKDNQTKVSSKKRKKPTPSPLPKGEKRNPTKEPPKKNKPPPIPPRPMKKRTKKLEEQ